MIKWIDCDDQMPPDDDRRIIVKLFYIRAGVEYMCTGKFCDYICMPASSFLAEVHNWPLSTKKFYTEYTYEKWSGLRIGALW